MGFNMNLIPFQNENSYTVLITDLTRKSIFTVGNTSLQYMHIPPVNTATCK